MASKKCTVCGTRGIATGKGDDADYAAALEMCNPCATEAGWENTHGDYGHDRISTIISAEGTGALGEGDTNEFKMMAHCWICHPKLNERIKADAKEAPSQGSKKQGTRRPQLNHKGHTHPQTPAARRACKAAFWASLTPVANVSSTEQLAAAMQGWNHSCDALGKPLPVKQASWTVVPRGPKGGVINQLKASKPTK